MSFIARKVDYRSKWDPNPRLATDEISADVVTRDLKTDENTLSFWRCETAKEVHIREVALAVTAGWEHLSKLDLVWIDLESVTADGVAFEDSEGRTPVSDLKETHVDAARLDVSRLGILARHIADAIRGTGRSRRLTAGNVLQILTDAVKSKRLQLNDLHENIRSKVESGVQRD